MPPQSLRQALQAHHEAVIVRLAETIRDWPIPSERQEAAEIHVRLALWERGLGQISEAVQCRVYSILHFAMPKDSAYEDEPTPLAGLEREAEWEAAYHEQLQRQSCPECGDGSCGT